jgi:hypothetical protein
MAALYAATDLNTLSWMFGRPDPKLKDRLTGVELVDLLLAYGADPNARLKAPLMQRHHTGGDPSLGDGATPFMRAAKSGDLPVMRLLLKYGADPEITQKNHKKAMMMAAASSARDGNAAIPTRTRHHQRTPSKPAEDVSGRRRGYSRGHRCRRHGAPCGCHARDPTCHPVPRDMGADVRAKNKRGGRRSMRPRAPGSERCAGGRRHFQKLTGRTVALVRGAIIVAAVRAGWKACQRRTYVEMDRERDAGPVRDGGRRGVCAGLRKDADREGSRGHPAAQRQPSRFSTAAGRRRRIPSPPTGRFVSGPAAH